MNKVVAPKRVPEKVEKKIHESPEADEGFVWGYVFDYAKGRFVSYVKPVQEARA